MVGNIDITEARMKNGFEVEVDEEFINSLCFEGERTNTEEQTRGYRSEDKAWSLYQE